MDLQNPNRRILRQVAALARALGIAVLSLTLGSAFCLCLLLGGTALAAS